MVTGVQTVQGRTIFEIAVSLNVHASTQIITTMDRAR